MTITPFGWLAFGGLALIIVAFICERLLYRAAIKRRPISEHQDSYWYRPHNGANGRSFHD